MEVFMKSAKKVWELQHQTVCKVVGMAFNAEDLKKIGKKFGISPRDPLMDHEFALHTTLVQVCSTDNKASRHVQKTIERRFMRYSRRLSGLEVAELIGWVTDGVGNPDIPLWAILWDLATRETNNGASLETALFGFIHMLEHKLMREHWSEAAKRTEDLERQQEAAEETIRLRRQMLDLQSDLERSRRLAEQLRVQLSEQSLANRQLTAVEKPQAQAMVQKSDRSEKVARLQTLLDEARCQKSFLEEECSSLRKEIEVLAREVSAASVVQFPESPDLASCGCPFRECLKQKRVAMVGGINSLECHYRGLVEAMGGTFKRHDGNCRGGECLIQDCVSQADLVVCPVEVNSHNAVKSVKKLCKSFGIPCCFPRTAGLSGFRTAIEEHFSESQVA
jgi:hypothetical protein